LENGQPNIKWHICDEYVLAAWNNYNIIFPLSCYDTPFIIDWPY
jgi:hypothetical protein